MNDTTARTLTFAPGAAGEPLYRSFGVSDERYKAVCELIDATVTMGYGETVLTLHGAELSDAEWMIALLSVGQLNGIVLERQRRLDFMRPILDALKSEQQSLERSLASSPD